MRPRRVAPALAILAAACLAALAAACTGSPATPATPAAEPPAVLLTEAFGGRAFECPIEIGAYLGAGGGMFVAEQDGRVYVLDEAGRASLLIDLRDGDYIPECPAGSPQGASA